MLKKGTSRPFPESNFYLFTIIAHNFVYAFIAAISLVRLFVHHSNRTKEESICALRMDSIVKDSTALACILLYLKRHIIEIAKGK